MGNILRLFLMELQFQRLTCKALEDTGQNRKNSKISGCDSLYFGVSFSLSPRAFICVVGL